MPKSVSIAVAGLIAAASGCYHGIGDGAGQGAGDGGGVDSQGSEAGDSDGGEDGGTGPDDAEVPAPSPRLFRLTHQQWENTVRDLFYLDRELGLADEFRTDPSVGGFVFDNNATTLEVDQALWQSYQRAAAEVATLMTEDAAVLAAILPPDGPDADARARAFITTFGARAFRRPLTPDEVDTLASAFATAGSLYREVDGFTAGVRLMVETMLQSPYFLYRVETSTAAQGEVIPLSGYELSQRMSYFLWDTMPDDELFAAAGADGLNDPEAVAEQAMRMLDDPRAHGVVESFHNQLLDVEKFAQFAPSAAFYPDAPDNLGALAEQEYQRFVEAVVFDRDGGLAELLTSTETFVNADLARIYGVDGNFGAEFVPATLDPSRRRGLLTQVGFLASNATSVNPDPIHRGAFVARRIACLNLAAPPDGIPPLPPGEGRTNRQTVEDHTEQPGSQCAGCHATIINPLGFPFENYDAVGAWRDEDAGATVDARAEVLLDGEQVPVGNALDLSDALAASPMVHECYLRHWLEFAHGRPFAPEDQALIARLGDDSQAGDLPVRELLVEVVTSTAFRTRATQELP